MPAAAAAAGLPPYGPPLTLPPPTYGEPGKAFGYGLATGASGIGGSPCCCWNCSTSLRSGPAATMPSSPTGGANACGMGSGIVCWKPAGGCAGEGMPRDGRRSSGGGGRDGRGRPRHDDDAVVPGRAGRRVGLGDAVDGHVARHAAHHDLEGLLLGDVDESQRDRRAGQLVGADDLDLPLSLPFRQDLAQGRLLGLERDLAVADDERDARRRRLGR